MKRKPTGVGLVIAMGSALGAALGVAADISHWLAIGVAGDSPSAQFSGTGESNCSSAPFCTGNMKHRYEAQVQVTKRSPHGVLYRVSTLVRPTSTT